MERCYGQASLFASGQVVYRVEAPGLLGQQTVQASSAMAGVCRKTTCEFEMSVHRRLKATCIRLGIDLHDHP